MIISSIMETLQNLCEINRQHFLQTENNLTNFSYESVLGLKNFNLKNLEANLTFFSWLEFQAVLKAFIFDSQTFEFCIRR